MQRPASKNLQITIAKTQLPLPEEVQTRDMSTLDDAPESIRIGSPSSAGHKRAAVMLEPLVNFFVQHSSSDGINRKSFKSELLVLDRRSSCLKTRRAWLVMYRGSTCGSLLSEGRQRYMLSIVAKSRASLFTDHLGFDR